jgi:hypothetical protein
MERLQYLSDLKLLLSKDIFELLGGLPKMTADAVAKHDDMPNIVICSRSMLVSTIYLEKLLEVYHGERVSFERAEKCTYGTIDYKTSAFFHEINMNCLQNCDRVTLVELLNSIVDHQSFSSRRHVIVLNNIDLMPNNIESTLHSIIERHNHTTWFVMVSSHTSKIPNMLKNRCLEVKLNLNVRTLYESLKNQLGMPHTHINDDNLDEFMLLCDHDPVNMCIMLEIENCENYRSHLFGFVRTHMDGLIAEFRVLGSPFSVVDYSKYAIHVREFATKTSSACIPLKDFAMQILKYTRLYFPKHTRSVLAIVSEMECLSHSINKHIFILEASIDKLVQLLVAV